jgi:hypothetical protein
MGDVGRVPSAERNRAHQDATERGRSASVRDGLRAASLSTATLPIVSCSTNAGTNQPRKDTAVRSRPATSPAGAALLVVISVLVALQAMGLLPAVAGQPTAHPDFNAIDRYVESEMRATGLPGVALGIVHATKLCTCAVSAAPTTPDDRSHRRPHSSSARAASRSPPWRSCNSRGRQTRPGRPGTALPALV